jgi:hypothetical protein
MTITSTPATLVTSPRFSTSQEVTAPSAAPRATNTSEKPSTNSAAPATTRPAARSPRCSTSWPLTPDM